MKESIFLALLRISIGFLFLWAFFDKLFGLSFSTTPDKSWLNGVSPTYGFLKMGTHGPFKPLFESLAGNQVVDILFMTGLLFIGIAFTLGIMRKLSTLSASILLILMYLALFPPANNPLIDEHIIYIFVVQLLLQLHSGNVWGLREWWEKTPLVKSYSFLK